MTDLFCGAGGSSTGAEQVPGVQVVIAANHWRRAVETHQENLPHAAHDVADISQVDPRRYPSTDLLWASPSCTHHSQARGRREQDRRPDLFGEVLPDEAAERSRATMWDVPRFAEAMALRGRPYRGFVVENVIEIRDWMYYDAWRAALRAAGYCLHVVYLDSAYAGRLGDPAPQHRSRWYCLGHLTGTPCPDLGKWTRPDAWCPGCGQTVRCVQAWKRPDRAHGRYGAQYLWRCPTTSCRGRQLHPVVLPAAAAIDWTLPGQRIGDRARPLAAKTLARITAGLHRHARPLLVPVEGRNGVNARTVLDPHRTQTARLQDALVVPLRNNNTAKLAHTAPLDTVAAAGNHHALITPAGHSTAAWAHLLVSYNRTGTARPVGDPMGTLTTRDRFGLLTHNQTDLADLVDPGAVASIDVNDCLFRMLEPAEIKAGMAFPTTYTVRGNRREQVRQCGNAVTPPAARDLVAALVEAITGEPVP